MKHHRSEAEQKRYVNGKRQFKREHAMRTALANKEIRENEVRYQAKTAASETKNFDKYADPLKFPDKFYRYVKDLILYNPVNCEYWEILAETPLALCFIFEDGTEKWMPKKIIKVNFRRKLVTSSRGIILRWGLERFIKAKTENK